MEGVHSGVWPYGRVGSWGWLRMFRAGVATHVQGVATQMRKRRHEG